MEDSELWKWRYERPTPTHTVFYGLYAVWAWYGVAFSFVQMYLRLVVTSAIRAFVGRMARPICHDDKSVRPARLILLEINVPFRTLHLLTSLLTRVSHRNNVANRHAK